MAQNTVRLKTHNNPVRKERIAAEACTPGMLITTDANGKLIKHATAGGNCEPYIAIEQDYIGKNIDDACAAGDQIPYDVAQRGDEYYMLLKAGENAARNALLASAGDGTLQVYTAQAVDEGGTETYTIYANAARFKALEAKNNTGQTAVRIKVEVL